MTDQGVVILGIPIPSSSPVFLSIVAVHVAAGLVCTVAGIIAMLSPKRAGRHPTSGTVYYWSLVVVFLTMAALSILRWPHNTHLLVLGILSFGAGVVGRRARRRLWRRWVPVHIAGMAVSYILLLTAFYVDNGPHLPLWSSLPPVAYWVGPSLIGIPILAWALVRHTKIRGSHATQAVESLTGLLLSPIIASAAMTFSSVSVIANALRLRRVQLSVAEGERDWNPKGREARWIFKSLAF